MQVRFKRIMTEEDSRMSILHDLRQFIGLELSPVSHRERLASLLGGIVCIPALFVVSGYYVQEDALVPIVASMGASAVLLFAVPHGALSQPWPLIGGHVVSAVIGVTCARLVPDHILAASLAVGLAIGAMHYLRCVHPPGGATALVAVIGGPAVTVLGYQYVLTPVAINAFVMFLVAFLFNVLFPWRRYPAHLHETLRPPHEAGHDAIRHEDFVYALSQMDTFVDVTEEDLVQIYELATRHHGEAARPFVSSARESAAVGRP
jgi:CBS domain-containing membrane protein